MPRFLVIDANAKTYQAYKNREREGTVEPAVFTRPLEPDEVEAMRLNPKRFLAEGCTTPEAHAPEVA